MVHILEQDGRLLLDWEDTNGVMTRSQSVGRHFGAAAMEKTSCPKFGQDQCYPSSSSGRERRLHPPRRPGRVSNIMGDEV